MASYRRFLYSLLCIISISALAGTTTRPNIVYFYVDDMGWGSIGANGQDDRRAAGLASVQTPNIDRLADAGINFSRAYGCMVCSPARSSQQTGFHQGHTWADRNNTDNAKKAMRAEDTTMGDALKTAGYATGYWGKWGYGASDSQAAPVLLNLQTLPNSHGYDHVLAELHHVRAHTFFQPTLWSFKPGDAQMNLVPNSMAAYANNADYPEYPASQSHSNYPAPAYCDDAYAFACLDFVRTQAQAFNADGTPFFGLFAAQIPHSPYGEVADLPEWDAAYAGDTNFTALTSQAQQWAAMVTRIDAHFGNILDALEDPNNDGDTSDSVADNTIVIFQSDNGGAGNNAIAELGSNADLRGKKGNIWEGGIRVPLVLRWPAAITSNSTLQAGTDNDLVFDVTDLLPTFCELAGSETPLGLDGVSLAATLRGEERGRVRDYLIHEAGADCSIIRGDYKLVSDNGVSKLYNLADDQSESTDISALNPELTAELATLLAGEATLTAWTANTYHSWTGANGASVSDAANWSDYVYSNTLNGLVYDTDAGAPRIPWIATMANTSATPATAIADADLEFLALEISGAQTLDLAGNTVTGRNEIRLKSEAAAELNGGTLASLRWIDINDGTTVQGPGTIDAILYNNGTLQTGTETISTTNITIIPGSGSGGSNIVINGGFELGTQADSDVDYSYNELTGWTTDGADPTKDGGKKTKPYAGLFRGLMAGGYNLVQDTGHIIQNGDTYQLEFQHAGFAGWDAADTLDVELFYDDGTRQTLFSFNINPASSEAWNQLTTNFPAITDPAATGNTLWLNFSPAGAGSAEYVSIDEVSLSIPETVTPPTTNITITTVAGASVSGDYHQSPSATLTAGLGAHTSLVVNGTANLGGRLECALSAGFSAAIGDRFSVVSADAVTGTFTHADGMIECDGHHFRIHYSANTVELEKVAVTAQGTPLWWLDEHSLATDLTDTDGDGLSEWEEYVAGTLPGNSNSVLTIEPDVQPLEPGYLVQWQSASNRLYDLHRSTNLPASFQTLATGILATPPENTYTDFTDNAAGFYRVQAKRN